MTSQRNKPYTEKSRKKISKKGVAVLGAISLGLIFVWKSPRQKSPLTIKGNPFPECVEVPAEKRELYRVYDHLLSGEKSKEVVHMLPPQEIPSWDDVDFDCSDSKVAESQKTSPPEGRGYTASGTRITPYSSVAPKRVQKDSVPLVIKKNPPLFFSRLRIGNNFESEKSAQNAIEHLKRHCPWPKNAAAQVLLLSSKDLEFALFVSGFDSQSSLDAYTKRLKEKIIPHSIVQLSGIRAYK